MSLYSSKFFAFGDISLIRNPPFSTPQLLYEIFPVKIPYPFRKSSIQDRVAYLQPDMKRNLVFFEEGHASVMDLVLVVAAAVAARSLVLVGLIYCGRADEG